MRETKKRSTKPTKAQLAVLLNVAAGFEPGLNKKRKTKNGDGGLAKTIVACRARGWLRDAEGFVTGIGPKHTITTKGREVAGLILKEVPLPPHLADLVPAHMRSPNV